MKKTTVGIIGTGRFASTLKALFTRDPSWIVKQSSMTKPVDGKTIFPFEEVARCELVIPAVPISVLESVVKKIKTQSVPNSSPLVISVCSVMTAPERWMLAGLSEDTDVLITHPLFGPQSTKNGTKFKGLPMVWSPVRVRDGERLEKLRLFLLKQQLNLISMTSDEHDQVMAKTQLMSFLFGQIGIELGLKKTPLDTKGFRHLMKNQAIVAGDTKQLFLDICAHNPHAREQLEKAREIMENIR